MFWRSRGGASSTWERSSLRSVTPVRWRGRNMARVQSRIACAGMCVYGSWHKHFLGAPRKSIVTFRLGHTSDLGTSEKESKQLVAHDATHQRNFERSPPRHAETFSPLCTAALRAPTPAVHQTKSRTTPSLECNTAGRKRVRVWCSWKTHQKLKSTQFA